MSELPPVPTPPTDAHANALGAEDDWGVPTEWQEAPQPAAAAPHQDWNVDPQHSNKNIVVLENGQDVRAVDRPVFETQQAELASSHAQALNELARVKPADYQVETVPEAPMMPDMPVVEAPKIADKPPETSPSAPQEEPEQVVKLKRYPGENWQVTRTEQDPDGKKTYYLKNAADPNRMFFAIEDDLVKPSAKPNAKPRAQSPDVKPNAASAAPAETTESKEKGELAEYDLASKALELKEKLDTAVRKEKDRRRRMQDDEPIESFERMLRRHLANEATLDGKELTDEDKEDLFALSQRPAGRLERMISATQPKPDNESQTVTAQDQSPASAPEAVTPDSPTPSPAETINPDERLRLAMSMLDGDDEPNDSGAGEGGEAPKRKRYLKGWEAATRYINNANRLIGFDFKPSEKKEHKLLSYLRGELAERRRATLAWIVGAVAMSGSAYRGIDYELEQKRSVEAEHAEQAAREKAAKDAEEEGEDKVET